MLVISIIQLNQDLSIFKGYFSSSGEEIYGFSYASKFAVLFLVLEVARDEVSYFVLNREVVFGGSVLFENSVEFFILSFKHFL
jgi:hypothetical protein